MGWIGNHGKAGIGDLAAPVVPGVEIPAGGVLASDEEVVGVEAGPVGTPVAYDVVPAQWAVEERIDFAVRTDDLA